MSRVKVLVGLEDDELFREWEQKSPHEQARELDAITAHILEDLQTRTDRTGGRPIYAVRIERDSRGICQWQLSTVDTGRIVSTGSLVSMAHTSPVLSKVVRTGPRQFRASASLPQARIAPQGTRIG